MLEPILCGLLSQAPLLPKLRGHFAEFLNNASSVGLRILSSSTCVGLRYGRQIHDSGFSRQYFRMLPYLKFGPRHAPGSDSGFSICPPHALVRVFSFRAHPSVLRPRSSDICRCRNLCLLSIGYVFRPRLRSRLPQSRSALLWKPWIFGLGDSHSHLATHSGILSSRLSTAPYRYRFSARSMLLYQSPSGDSSASAVCFSPGNFRRRTSRPVSCYALFQCLAASEPTSWLSSKSHILYHLTHTLGP